MRRKHRINPTTKYIRRLNRSRGVIFDFMIARVLDECLDNLSGHMGMRRGDVLSQLLVDADADNKSEVIPSNGQIRCYAAITPEAYAALESLKRKWRPANRRTATGSAVIRRVLAQANFWLTQEGQ